MTVNAYNKFGKQRIWKGTNYMTQNEASTHTLACNLSEIPAEERTAHVATIPQIFQTVEAVQEFDNGYAFQLSNQSGLWMMVARFVENERRCCPFLRFALVVEPNNGPIWLHLTGEGEVKRLLETMFGEQSNIATLKQQIDSGKNKELGTAVAHAVSQLA